MIKKKWLIFLSFVMISNFVFANTKDSLSQDESLKVELDSIIVNCNAASKVNCLKQIAEKYKKKENYKAVAYLQYKIGGFFFYEQPDSAIHYFKRSLQILIDQKINFQNLRRRNAHNIAAKYREIKAYSYALEYHDIAIQNAKSNKEIITSIEKIGRINRDIGKYQAALDYFLIIENRIDTVNISNPIQYLNLLSNIAGTHRELGNTKECINYYKLMNQSVHRLKDSIDEFQFNYKLSDINLGMGNLMLDIDSFKRAEFYYKLANKFAKKNADLEMEYLSYGNLLVNSVKLKDAASTDIYLQHLLKNKGLASDETVTMGYLGDYYLVNRDTNKAEEYYQKAIDLLFNHNKIHSFKTIDSTIETSQQLQILTDYITRKVNFYEENSNESEALDGLKYCQIADTLLYEMHKKLYQNSSKIEWRKRLNKVHQYGLKFAAILNDKNAAQYFSSRNKYQLLKDKQIENHLLLDDSQFEEFYSKLKSLEENKNSNPYDYNLVSNYYSHYNRLQSRYKHNRELDKHLLSSTYSIYDNIPDSTLVIEFYQSNNFVFILYANQDSSWMLTQNSSELIESIHLLLSEIRKPFSSKKSEQNYRRQAFKLYKSIFPKNIDYAKNIIVIPSGIFNLLPFEALIKSEESSHYLLLDHAINYQLTADVFEFNIRSKPQNRVSLLAPINYTNKLVSLKGSEEEVNEISRIIRSKSMLNATANKSAFIDALENSDVIHASTHASGGELDEEPWIALQDAKISLSEIYRLNSTAEMVVLSACETHIGEIKKGEGVFSLTHSLFYSGAKSVVATLWSVNDESTKEISIGFYKKLKEGMPKDEALRASKLDYLNSVSTYKQSPYFWAPLIILGKNDPIKLKNKPSRIPLFIGISAILIILFFVYRKFS